MTHAAYICYFNLKVKHVAVTWSLTRSTLIQVTDEKALCVHQCFVTADDIVIYFKTLFLKGQIKFLSPKNAQQHITQLKTSFHK
jgi:hypothetical protein